MFRRIVVALDGSPLAETILPHVRRLAADTAAEVLLLTVSPKPDDGQMSADTGTYVNKVMTQGRDRLRYLLDHARQLKTDGITARTEMRFGDPAVEIVRYADEQDADAIAMSTHGRSGLDRMVHGSVAERILRSTQRPVILLRPDAAALSSE